MTSHGLAVGFKRTQKNKDQPDVRGHRTTLIARKHRVGSRKGLRRSSRAKLVSEVIREVSGYAPYEKRIMELLKNGLDKRALRAAKRRLGSHQRAKAKREQLAEVIRQQNVAKQRKLADKAAAADKTPASDDRPKPVEGHKDKAPAEGSTREGRKSVIGDGVKTLLSAADGIADKDGGKEGKDGDEEKGVSKELTHMTAARPKIGGKKKPTKRRGSFVAPTTKEKEGESDEEKEPKAADGE